MKLLMPLGVYSGLKYKFDLIVKNSNRADLFISVYRIRKSTHKKISKTKKLKLEKK